MAGYFDTLNATQKQNIALLTKRMTEKGITNPFTQAAILAVASKESAFLPKAELSYKSTANDRIRAIFGKRLAAYNDAQLTALKANDNDFFDAVYGFKTDVGKQLGNTAAGDGFKYRGRGYNQITFKNLYKKYGGLIGVDLINNPDKLNEPAVAADALIEYFKESFKAAPKATLAAYNTTGLNDFKNIQDSTNAVYHANAGWGKSLDRIASDPTGGRQKAIERSGGFLDMVKGATGAAVDASVEFAKKNPLTTIAITAGIVISAYILYTKLKNK